MSERLTNIQVENFLQNYGEIEILEEGKEKSELEKIANARGIKIKGSRDLAIFKTIWAFTDIPNSNNAVLPHKELLRVLPQIVGKPINKNHDRRYVLGHYIDYRYNQKENKVLAYGIFYKSNFGEEFEEAKNLFKKKKLASSFEIWSPKNKRKYREDGSYELFNMEIAGGALIFMDKENEPAFPDAKILEFSKKLEQDQPELIYAKKYKEDEIITSAGEVVVLKEKEVVQTISKIKCSNCGEEFDSGVIDKIKCPKCLAILDKSGNMIYPPQIKDFKMLCPNCSTNNWLILSKQEDKNKVRCMGCTKEYDLTFATKKEHNVADDFNFLYTSKVSCLQCHTPIYVAGVSSIKTRSIKCKRCGLTFSYDINHDRYKNITNIEEVIPKKENEIDKSKESSEEGGKEMKKKVEKASEKKVEEKVKIEKVEPKKDVEVKEVKKEEVKKEISEKIEPKAKETPKVEKTPKTAEKVEEPKAKEKSEVKKEEVKVDKEVEKAEEKPEAEKEAKETPKAEEPKVEKKTTDATIVIPEEITPKEKAELITKVEASKMDKFIVGIKKLAKQVKTLRKEKASLNKKVELYATNAKKIIERRAELGETELTDEEILNDDKFGKVKAEKELASAKVVELNKGNDITGVKYAHDDKWYAKKRKAVDKEAFRKSE